MKHHETSADLRCRHKRHLSKLDFNMQHLPVVWPPSPLIDIHFMPPVADPTISSSLTTPAPNPWTASMPGLFVFLWSTGFVVAKFGLPYSPPLTFLLLRFTGVA